MMSTNFGLGWSAAHPGVGKATLDPGFGFHLIVVSLISALLALFSTHAVAKDEYRKPVFTWKLSSGTSGDFDTPDGVIDAMNARSDAAFEVCVANAKCTGCTKSNWRSISKVSGYYPVKINGVITSLSTNGSWKTDYSQPACDISGSTGPKGPTTVYTTSGGIGVLGISHCPSGWTRQSRDLGFETIDGIVVPVREERCKREIPEPCKSGCSTRFGNPIDAVAGAKLASEEDYSSSDGQLKVQRTYSSAAGRWAWNHSTSLVDFTGRHAERSPAANLSAFIPAVPAGLFSYTTPLLQSAPRIKSFALVESDWSSIGKEVAILIGQQRLVFVENAPGVFTTNALSKPQLTVSGSGATVQWRLKRSDHGFDFFDGAGNLVRQVALDGKALTLTREGSAMVVTALPSGRRVVYSSTPGVPPGYFDNVTLPDGTSLNYQFAENALVTEVRFSDSKVKRYLYDETIHTNTSAGTNWLTGWVDEMSVRQATYTYQAGLPKSTELAGGLNKYGFYFVGYRTDVTSPLTGGNMSLNWDRGPDGERRLTSRTQAAGAGSGFSTHSITYDAGGHKAREDDFTRKRTCYANEAARGLESARVEGLTTTADCATLTPTSAILPAGSRKVSTQWHPDWRLESKVAEPGKITTLVYNGQPDPTAGGAVAACAPAGAVLPDGKPIAVLCKRVEQATTDVNGAAGFAAAAEAGVAPRTWTWTYNNFGQVLTEDGPRTDVADVTTYEYYTATAFTGTDPNAVGVTVGDLKSVTNAVGKTTQFTKYNKHGQLLESIDGNGVVSSYTYDLRQRILSATVGDQTTRYTYDDAGQLKRITRPDSTWLGYDYDPAHRLTAAYDNLGNRIEYTLDNAGNKTEERVTDPTGALRRQLARSIDALGRVQQTTGRE